MRDVSLVEFLEIQRRIAILFSLGKKDQAMKAEAIIDEELWRCYAAISERFEALGMGWIVTDERPRELNTRTRGRSS